MDVDALVFISKNWRAITIKHSDLIVKSLSSKVEFRQFQNEVFGYFLDSVWCYWLISSKNPQLKLMKMHTHIR